MLGKFLGNEFATPVTAVTLMVAAMLIYAGMACRLHVGTPAFIWLALVLAFLVEANLECLPARWMTKGFAVALAGAAAVCVIF
ncbi:MAG: hypothetical protein WC702_02315 [Patescibacteria group bacterium]|jgi:hypothetical protein